MSESDSQHSVSGVFGLADQERALDGLLREYARAGAGVDEAFVRRVLTAVGAATQSGRSVTEAGRTGLLRSRWFRVGLAAACLLFLFALSRVFHSSGPNMMRVSERELVYQQVGGRKLGTYLAGRYPGARAVVIVEPPAGLDELASGSRLVDGLRQGFGDSIEIVAEIAPEIPGAARSAFARDQRSPAGEKLMPGEVLPPLEFWYTPHVFDGIVAQYRTRCDLIVSTIGLPMHAMEMRYWAMPDAPALALAGGSVYELESFIERGLVCAAVTYNPKAVYDEKAPPADLDEAFSKRYLLVTPDNVDDVTREHSDIFK